MENENLLADEQKKIIEELIKVISVDNEYYYKSTYEIAVEVKKLFSTLSAEKKSKVESLSERDIQIILGLNS